LDLGAVQAELAQGLEASATGLSCRQAVWAPSFMGPSSPSVDDDFGAAGLGRGDDRVQQSEVVRALGERGEAWEPLQPRDLLQEGPGLESEQVVLPVATPGKSIGGPPARYGWAGPTSTCR
jgi:hypothetical protein